jgi:hypothetical protein
LCRNPQTLCYFLRMPKPKPRKPAGKLFTPTAPPQVGDKVIPNDSPLVFEIIKIASDGELTLNAPGTVLHRFRVDPATVKFVDQPRSQVRPSKPAEPEIDAAEVMKRVTQKTIQHESLDRFDDDVALLTKDLQRQSVPKAALNALEALTAEVHESWKAAAEKLEELLPL